MNTPSTHASCVLLAGAAEVERQRAFTRWMSHDLLRAATDFCQNIG